MKCRILSWLPCLAMIISALGILSFSASAVEGKASIAFDEAYLIINLGETGTIHTAATGGPITWTSRDKSIATVDKTGTITGVGLGITYVTASLNGMSADCKVSVGIPQDSTRQKGGMDSCVIPDGTQFLREAIHLRDVFILVHDGKYYMYGTSGEDAFNTSMDGYDCYVSEDLETFTYHEVYHATKEEIEKYGISNHLWAPEVWEVGGAFYMMTAWDIEGSQQLSILEADNPLGPFKVWGFNIAQGNDPTLYEEDGKYYLVCHSGGLSAYQLSDDFTSVAGRKTELFVREDAPWAVGGPNEGAFVYRTQTGRLILMWSSFSSKSSVAADDVMGGGMTGGPPQGGMPDVTGGFPGFGNMTYNIGLAVSDNGSIFNCSWEHAGYPLTSGDMGHGMLFNDLDGNLKLAICYPDSSTQNPFFIDVVYDEKNDTIYIAEPGAEITLSETSLTLMAGDTASIEASTTHLPVNQPPYWKSSNERVATVDENGVITAVGSGSAFVTAYLNDAQAFCAVTVSTEDQTFSLPLGETTNGSGS